MIKIEITSEQAQRLLEFMDDCLYSGSVESEDDYVLLETFYDQVRAANNV